MSWIGVAVVTGRFCPGETARRRNMTKLTTRNTANPNRTEPKSPLHTFPFF
jgi:hypothetical protein